MKKVGIATLHYSDNFGAVLQCYALQKILNGLEGIEAEVINYCPVEYQRAVSRTNERQTQLFERKRAKFAAFLNQHCHLSRSKMPVLDGAGYDCCCVGSDQVWNTSWPMVDQYFLQHVPPQVQKIAYAASVGCSVSDPKFDKERFAKYLPRFQAISLRENEHVELLSELSGKDCRRALDPTLLLDAEDYCAVTAERDAPAAPFLFFYWLPHDDTLLRGAALANQIARKYGLKIVHSMPTAKAGMFFGEEACMYYEGVEDFLWYIKNAAFIVTNSYHGTIFSIQFERPFYSYVVENMGSRFDTLCSYAPIGGRIVRRMLRNDEITGDVDFKRIKADILPERDASIRFLKEALEMNVEPINAGNEEVACGEQYGEISRAPEAETLTKPPVAAAERAAYQYPLVVRYLKRMMAADSPVSTIRRLGLKRLALYAVTELMDLLLEDIRRSGTDLEVCIGCRSPEKYADRYAGTVVIGIPELCRLEACGDLDGVIICNPPRESEIVSELLRAGFPSDKIYSISGIVFD